MRTMFASVAVLALLTSAPAAAQDTEESGQFSDMADRMTDPAFQDQMALMLQTMSEILLDMPIAPMMEAMAEATGQETDRVDPDATLRKIAPGADRVPAQIAEQTPRMMRAMGGMAKGMEKMAPAMREMARRMKDAMPPAMQE